MAPKKPVDQSRTQWVKAGTKLSDGTIVKKGYVSQLGKPEKKVTGQIKMAVDTGGVKAGATQSYVKGRRVDATSSKTTAGKSTSSKSTTPTPKPKPKPKPDSTSKSMSPTKSPGTAAGTPTASRNVTKSPGTPAGTPNTKARKYQTPGPDLGKAYEAWKAKPMISAKDKELARKKAEFEKKAKAAIKSRFKKGK